MGSNGYLNDNYHNEKHKYIFPKENNFDKIRDKYNVQNQHALRKHINDDDASKAFTDLLQLKVLNSKQSSCFNLTSKFEGYILDNNNFIKSASKQAFTINIDKVEPKTQLNNVIEKVEKCNNKLDALFKRNLMSCKNISTILPCLSVFLGVPQHSSCKLLDRITTTECSYRKWEKEELNISKLNINPTDDFIAEVKNALNSENKEVQLRRISKEYGNFYALRVIGGIKEHINGFSLKSWIKSLNNYDAWDIIEYDEIYSIFDILDDNLQNEIFDALGHRILQAGVNDIPLNWDFSTNATYVHSLSMQFMDLNEITNINNCYIFASIIDKSDRDIFSLRIAYMNEHIPLIIVHRKNSLHKKYPNSPIKVGWIIVGQPINFDFDQANYPVVLKSGGLPISKVDNQYKIEFPKYGDIIESCILNTCMLGLPKINSKCSMRLSVYDIKDINQLINDENGSQRTASFCW
ncbi:10117_t:CDS:2 [Dentiscutata erythropus]|uniref:10117_t:CDS:1 n=1 Tax=Dentiscutata erythropus TaxID=1348616 RepID=A0A9N8VCI6_9GLOM|nr:10117_t:CDS:2 [Dentiscutata erythropus]